MFTMRINWEDNIEKNGKLSFDILFIIQEQLILGFEYIIISFLTFTRAQIYAKHR